MARVFLLGVVTIDFVFHLASMPRRTEKYRADDATIVVGGCAANAAIAVARLGGNAVLGGRLGDDPVGDLIVKALGQEGIDCRGIRRTPGARSAYSSVYVDAEGERQIVNFRGENLCTDTGWIGSVDGRVDAVLADTRWFDGAEAAMRLARSRDVPGIIDAEAPIHEQPLRSASHVAFSEQGLTDWIGSLDIAEAASRLGTWCCVTAGARDVRIAHGAREQAVPAFRIDPVDTLGAGDVWHGAFALALAEGKCDVDAIRFANAAAALKCLTRGGARGTPTRTETEALIRTQT